VTVDRSLQRIDIVLQIGGCVRIDRAALGCLHTADHHGPDGAGDTGCARAGSLDHTTGMLQTRDTELDIRELFPNHLEIRIFLDGREEAGGCPDQQDAQKHLFHV
jgi:hypothetical protein